MECSKKQGFTLIEVMIASIISVVVIGGVMAAFVEGLQVWERQRIKSELNFDLELAMEWLRTDLRLSSVGVGLMSFYPSSGTEYEAISLPLSEDMDGDGLLDRDTDDTIKWTKTIIYHVRPGDPDKLYRTVYDSRFSNATPADIYQQLSDVVAATNLAGLQAAALSGETVITKVIFENLVQLTFRPPFSTYDCYAPTREKGDTYNWGSVVLSNGLHQLTFTVQGKNTNSSGYKIAFDKLTLSASASDREGEHVTPEDDHPPTSGWFEYSSLTGAVSAVDRSTNGSSWSGNCELIFDAAGPGDEITFEVYNDLWCDNNFLGGQIYSNCSIKYDDSFTTTDPFTPDMVVSMDKGIAWTATGCGVAAAAMTYTNLTSITNIIYGGTNNPDMTISRNGVWTKLFFERGAGNALTITNVVITDPVSNVSASVTFNGGDDYVYMPSDGPVITNSDWISMWEIKKNQNYRVNFDMVTPVADDDYDMFVGDGGGDIKFFENTGTKWVPAFGGGSPNWQGINVGAWAAPAFGDIDNDGDGDLFVGKADGSISYYRNDDGTMTLVTNKWLSISFGLFARPHLADYDGDSDLDVFIGNNIGVISVVKNTGTVAVAEWAAPDLLRDSTTAIIALGAGGGPSLADIDNDGDMDLFSGNNSFQLYYWENTGSSTNPVFTYVTNQYINPGFGSYYKADFLDIDNDGDLDMMLGRGGNVEYWRNDGSPAVASWTLVNANYLGGMSGASYPAHWNIDGDTPVANGAATWQNNDSFTNGLPLAYSNGVAIDRLVALSSIEVGYPFQAVFRSDVFDTQTAAPVFNELNWTQVEEDWPEGDVDIRIRSSDWVNMGDLLVTDWLGDGGFGADKYFNDNTANDLTTGPLPNKRYVQYEVKLGCNNESAHDKIWAHTNVSKAKVRDVTIDWPGPTGLVDLTVDFGKGPDCGIVGVTVDGQSFMKGVEIEMEIFKAGRTETNSVSGRVEVRPLNTGR